MKLSAIIINKNGGKKLKNCLQSLRFCDEILLVDAGSTDNSIDIAKNAEIKIIKADRDDFACSRNIGAQKAQGEWLLYIDVDERISPALREKILCVVTPNIPNFPNLPNFSSYKLFRKNIILGKWLRHGDWWPDPVHRLIKKSALVEWKGALHEYPIVKGRIGLIKEPIIHLSKDSISDMVKNSRDFAPREAKLMLEANHPPVQIYHFLIAMGREFWKRGIVKMGWLDGATGIIEVFYQMFHQFLVYSTLWQMQKKFKTQNSKCKATM